MINSKNTIILLDKNSNFSEFKNYLKKYPKAEIFPLDFFSHDLLRNEKIPHNIPDDLLNNDDYLKIDSFSRTLTSTWYQNKNLQNNLEFEKIPLGNLIELELYQYFMNIIIELFLSKRIIEKLEPELIITSAQINEFIIDYCKQKNLDHIDAPILKNESLVLENLNIKLNLGKFPISFKISRKRFHKLKSFNDNFFFNISDVKFDNSKNKKSSILFFEFNSENYDDLLNELSTIDKNILLLNTRRPVIWNFKTRRIILKNNCKVIDLNSYKNKIDKKINEDLNKFQKKFDEIWKHNSLFEEIFSFDSIPFWSSINKSFVNICNSRFSESISRIHLFKEFLSNSNISTILLWAETGQEEKELIYVAKILKIKIIWLQHAMAASENVFSESGKFISHLSHSSLSDKQLVWGEPAKSFGLSNFPSNDIVVAGSPRHDKFFNSQNTTQKSDIVLFAPTKPSPLYSKSISINSSENFIRVFKDVLKIMKTFPDKKLIIKPHPTPAVFVDFKEIAKKIDPTVTFTYDSDLVKLISNCDLLITTNNSTIAIEAMMLQKPVISLQTEDSALEENIAKNNAILSLIDSKNLKNHLELIFSDQLYRKKLLENSNKFLKTFFANAGNSSKFLKTILDK